MLRMSQPNGDQETTFIVEGRGWPPGARLTVRLKGIGASRVHPPVDRAGSFNYAINQDHEFFDGGLRPGRYTVIVTGPGGREAKARFVVGPPPGTPGGPPGGFPGGAPPPPA